MILSIQKLLRYLLFSDIPRNAIWKWQEGHGKSIFDFNPYCNGAKDYAQLVEEVVLLTRPEISALRQEIGGEAKV